MNNSRSSDNGNRVGFCGSLFGFTAKAAENGWSAGLARSHSVVIILAGLYHTRWDGTLCGQMPCLREVGVAFKSWPMSSSGATFDPCFEVMCSG